MEKHDVAGPFFSGLVSHHFVAVLTPHEDWWVHLGTGVLTGVLVSGIWSGAKAFWRWAVTYKR